MKWKPSLREYRARSIEAIVWYKAQVEEGKNVGCCCEGVTVQVPERGRCLVIGGRNKIVLKQRRYNL